MREFILVRWWTRRNSQHKHREMCRMFTNTPADAEAHSTLDNEYNFVNYRAASDQRLDSRISVKCSERCSLLVITVNKRLTQPMEVSVSSDQLSS